MADSASATKNHSRKALPPGAGSPESPIDLKECARRRRAAVPVRSSPRKRTTPRKYSSPAPAPKRSTPNRAGRTLTFSPVPQESSGDDDSIIDVEASPQRPSKLARSDQVTLHSVGMRFRNLLKLPKAHKWCYYEWFYSDIDQPLFEGENDFCRCLEEMFPELKTRLLNRVQWRQLRRLMGKPRRCSPTFFSEERQLVESKRNRIRALQKQVHQGMVTAEGLAVFRDLPDELPALLVVGTAVTARLHSSDAQDSSYYSGVVEAVDIENHRYWVTFDRPGLGNHPIPDTEIKSSRANEVIRISALEAAHKTQRTWPPRNLFEHIQSSQNLPGAGSLLSPERASDPFLTSTPARSKMLIDTPSQAEAPAQQGGYQVDFLRQIGELAKLLQLKQDKIKSLSVMNTEMEKLNARQVAADTDIQRRYATVVVHLDDINAEVNSRLESIKSHCEALGFGPSQDSAGLSSLEAAHKITADCNRGLEATGSGVKDQAVLDLVGQLTGLLLQIEKLSKSGNSLDYSSLTTSLDSIGRSVHMHNRKCYQDNVETPITLIQSGLNPGGPLHAFSTGHHRTLS